ncbi:putative actin cytoskeleton protein (VIP1) [Aspergillus homomorphus CBS 101889]|uniref:Putative actin cytoskeleton protein n=1 Tax=Aspergillus homomorphus (strain CBS 101889) TaxID=1450537 RepID=A0A395HVW6_ASPHC|nr:putative actin cytoskeleton protein [Aspergillus homomorphus CBS 101889]RAL11669.1 putative actin cytoskeleton protein [Aspergillus homomorphus CBS 101889]
MSERSTVHVEGIAPATSDKEVQDFFSFCGKITSLSVTPVSGEADAQKSATVTFEKEAAAKTALLLDHTQLGTSVVHVKAAHSLDDIAGDHAASASEAKDEHDHDLEQEDKPRSRIVAEYLAQGYVLSDTAIQKAIALDQKHGFSSRFTSALNNFDKKYNATDKAKGLDENYKITEKASSGWRGLHSYFEKALETPSGRKLREFYAQTDKQVRDIHNEARRLADLKSGKSEGDEHNADASTAGAGAESAGVAPATSSSQPAGTAAPAEQKA